MTDASQVYWNAYASGILRASATGGPLVSQVYDSLNAKYKHNFSTDTNYTLANDVKMDRLYTLDDFGYWIATKDEGNNDSVRYMNERGYCGYLGGKTNSLGIRPVIKLPSDLKMTWNGTAWEIDPDQLTGTITAQNYGDPVHYEDPAGVWQSEGNGWKLFLEEDGSKYLISSEYVKRQFLNLNSNLVIPGNGDIGVAGKTKVGLGTWLTTFSYWSSFKHTTLAREVKGGCSLEQFWLSYNGKYKTDHSGLNVVLAEEPGGEDTLYFNQDLDGVDGYWLGEDGSTGDGDYFPRVGYGKGVTGTVYNALYRGVRPLVQLSPETKMRWDGSQWILYKENTN